MAVHGQTMRAGQPRRPRADHRDAPARRFGAGEGMAVLLHHPVGCVALQPADPDRFTLGRFADAGFFAQRLGGTDTGAHAAEDVLAENRLGRGLGGAGGDLPDEERDVDRRRAGGDAGRIMAEIAALCRHQGLMIVEGGMQIGEVLGIGLCGQPSGRNPRGQRVVGQLVLPDWTCVLASVCHRKIFYQLVKYGPDSGRARLEIAAARGWSMLLESGTRSRAFRARETKGWHVLHDGG